ncbi:MAG: hypothetical protein JXR51_04540 [Bacteroidales bacterium]|nr:hypothetical protein [Bacteroidales bacterium]
MKGVLFCTLCFSVFFASCEWVTVEPVEVIIPDKPISFASDIQPIFTSKCDQCHPSQAGLDLTDGNAWASINDGRLNLTAPNQSLIYTKPDPNGTHPEKYSATESLLVLTWIEEGALDN